MEIVTSWMERGIERGIIQGELKIIKRVINKKIDEIAPQLWERISQLSSPQLEDFAEALLDLSVEEDLESWLEQNT